MEKREKKGKERYKGGITVGMMVTTDQDFSEKPFLAAWKYFTRLILRREKNNALLKRLKR